MPTYDDPYIPGAHAHLNWMIGTNGILYAREMQTGATFQMFQAPSPPATVPPAGTPGPPGPPGPAGPAGPVAEAPTDGQTYGRQDTGWIVVPPVPATSLLINTLQPVSALESTSPQLAVNGTGFTPASVINWGGFPLATTFVDNTNLTATLNLGPGSSGVYTVWVTDGTQKSNSVAFTVTPAAVTVSGQPVTLTLGASGPTCALSINADGDLIISQSVGPNAGKSVNMTYARWQA
jgi:hypothetical protein